MKITNELLNRLIAEQMERIDEKETYATVNRSVARQNDPYAKGLGFDSFTDFQAKTGNVTGQLL